VSFVICLFLLGYAFDKTDRRKDFIPADKIKFGIRGYKFTLQPAKFPSFTRRVELLGEIDEAFEHVRRGVDELLLLFPQAAGVPSGILIFFILSLLGLLCFDAYSQMLLF
jgi:hypothetical protein